MHRSLTRLFSPPALLGALAVGLAACTPPPPPPLPPIVDRFEVTAANFTAPALVPVAWAVRDPNGDPLTCRLDVQSDGVWDETITPCPSSGGRNIVAAQGAHTARFEVADADHAPVAASAAFSVGPGPSETSYDIDAHLVSAPDPRMTEALAEAVQRWERVVSRGVPDAVVHQDPGGCTSEMPGFDGAVDDLRVEVVVVSEVSGFMADAVPCVVGPDGLPRLGLIRMDGDWIEWMYDHGQLGDLMTHEMGHVLGFDAANWWVYRRQNGIDFEFTGPRANAEWSHLGGTGVVPLNDGGDHWDETILQDEVMTCAMENVPEHPLSALSVATLGDIGYHVDLGGADPWTVPPEPGYMTC